ncbi:hypothetical protein D3C71_2164340 [compost metagenome]
MISHLKKLIECRWNLKVVISEDGFIVPEHILTVNVKWDIINVIPKTKHIDDLWRKYCIPAFFFVQII